MQTIGNIGTHNALVFFRMLAKCCGFKTEKCPDLSRTMTPGGHRHRSTTLEQKRFSF